MTNCMHFIHPPKLYKFYEVVMIILCLEKIGHYFWRRVYIDAPFMCTLHLWPGIWDTSQRKLMTFHQLSQQIIYLDWLDFYVYVINIQSMLIIFSFWKYNFFAGKKNTKLGTSPTRRHVMNCQLYKFVIVIDWSMKCDFFYLPSAVML